MKKMFLIISLFVISMNALAQNLAVYGVSFGDDMYSVKSVLEEKGKKVKSGTTQTGYEYLEIKSPSVGGAKFERGFFRFDSSDRLSFISFSSQDIGGTGDPGMPWEAEFLRKAKSYNQTFMTMYQNLRMKYGSPSTATDGMAMWQFGNQRITLEYNYNYEYNAFGWIDHSASVFLRYEVVDVDSLDF